MPQGKLASRQELDRLAALLSAGKLREAATLAQTLTTRFPRHAAAWIALATAWRKLGWSADALEPARKAAELAPQDPEARCTLGDVLHELKRFDEARATYARVHARYADTLLESAASLDAGQALEAIRRSLRIRETDAAKGSFVACVKGLVFGSVDDELRALVTRALVEPWGRPAELVPLAVNLLKLAPAIDFADPLLHALLVSAPVADAEMERTLTSARREQLAANAPDLRFCSALAQQCFINEYIFPSTEAELRKATALAASLETDVAVAQAATYFPLGALQLGDRTGPPEIAALLEQQVREPAEERRLRAAIPALTPIEDEVSVRVQTQYEENPYPRWVRLAPRGAPVKINEALRGAFPLARFRPLANGDAPEILVAGCGTGQHPIATAQLFEGAKVLAVDLSLSSLAYAKRKTLEMNLASIEYAQADLLKLGSIERRFDAIECVGVLHHLADPWAGWRVLLSLLRPGGVMKIGLYSELARRHVVEARALIRERGYGDDIRRARQALLDSGHPVTKSTDFFSLSSCRDLLFHTQEQRTRLTDIAAFLRENDLVFLGFENREIVEAYLRRFPGDRAAIDLAQWQRFEKEKPNTFLDMYVFWVQAHANSAS